MQRIVVVIPTFNEAENLPLLVPRILEQDPRIEVLVVDDNSPDGRNRAAGTRDGEGTLRVLLLNRSDEKRKSKASIDGKKRRPLSVYAFDAPPGGGIASAAPKKKLVLPPRSVVVAEY